MPRVRSGGRADCGRRARRDGCGNRARRAGPAGAPREQAPLVDELPLGVPQTGRDELPSRVAPLSGETFKVQFTASRSLRDKLRQAQDLLRHRVPDGDVPTIIERALELLIEEVKKERFGVGAGRGRQRAWHRAD